MVLYALVAAAAQFSCWHKLTVHCTATSPSALTGSSAVQLFEYRDLDYSQFIFQRLYNRHHCHLPKCVRPAGFPASLEPLFGAPAATGHLFHGSLNLMLPPDRPACPMSA